MTPGARTTATPGRLTAGFGAEREVDRIRPAEDIRHGRPIEAFVVKAWTDRGWSRVATAVAVGASRILLLAAPVRARRWRVRVTAARAAVRTAEFGLYRSRT
ncbi:hypothetical protein BIV25_26900 [Streptomyces sp. MUSC 14]|uniref:hypothetical protein n=1 Tax=Streptomyces sp. MUSC 14 TaxID=1354889 RepID=UPI0008F5C987|nr:hypothetical protein BIV25_26900 [Streptomyces sp. MUSC 14]